jgi:hypothetical protein
MERERDEIRALARWRLSPMGVSVRLKREWAMPPWRGPLDVYRHRRWPVEARTHNAECYLTMDIHYWGSAEEAYFAYLFMIEVAREDLAWTYQKCQTLARDPADMSEYNISLRQAWRRENILTLLQWFAYHPRLSSIAC